MDRFRDLERAGETGRKDAALLAAIAGFEALKHPTFHDLRQFSNLFIGLFSLTSEKTRRTAAAALSRLRALPQEVCMIIADQPIRICAPFLALNPSISDPVLLQAINRHGNPHARAVSRRPELSAKLVDVLLELNDTAVARSLQLHHGVETPLAARGQEALAGLCNDNALRDRLKAMALSRMHERKGIAVGPVATGRPDHTHWARLARPAQRTHFKVLLSRAMGAEEDLAERILLDDSGTQLAMALQSLNLAAPIILGAMVGLFPALRDVSDGIRHADAVLQSLDRVASAQRVAAWVRANAPMRTRHLVQHAPLNNNGETVRQPVSTRSLQASGRSETLVRLKRA